MTFDPSSREAQAQAEIAATRLARGAAPALVAGFVALVASQPLLELRAAARGASAILAPLAAPGAGTGRLATARSGIAEIEARYDERSALVGALRPRVQRLLTRFAGYGNERVIVGRERWLYYREDVEHLTSRAPAESFAGDPEAAIVDFHRQLAARSIRLLVVPVPVKPMIHPERLTGHRLPGPLRRRGEEELLAALAARGVEVLDLAPLFHDRARFEETYLATDTHWRPEAMEIAAREIALRLRAMADLPPGEPDNFKEEPNSVEAPGDTLQLLEISATAHLYPDELVRLRRVLVHPGTDLDEPGAPVILLGDSFAGIFGGDRWGADAGLRHRLAYQLGLPVGFVSQAGGGAMGVRLRLVQKLAENPTLLRGVRVVVWEFASRALSRNDWQLVELP